MVVGGWQCDDSEGAASLEVAVVQEAIVRACPPLMLASLRRFLDILRARAAEKERYGLIGFAFSLFSWFFVNQTIVVLAALVGVAVSETRGASPSRSETTVP